MARVGRCVWGQVLQHFPDILEKEITAPFGNAEQHIQLGKADDDGRGVHETENDRVRDEIDDTAELDHSENKLDTAHQKGEEQGQTDVALGAAAWQAA